jgi:triphosphoribosyl-dephospho-CoA synthase
MFTSQQIATAAEQALFYEVALTPKPGLVDRANNGAHADMNFTTFIDSITALAPYLAQYVAAGQTHHGANGALFDKLRTIGATAERAMLAATHNINTHKGANFSFAILLGATGLHLQHTRNRRFTAQDTSQILTLAATLTQNLVQKDFANLANKTTLSYGEKLYVDYGITGIRGEAAAGYPMLRQVLLPYFRAHKTEKTETLLLHALILLMSEIEDGNLLHRGGVAAWQQIKKETKKIHQANLSEKEFVDELSHYDQLLIARHLSPGGAADVLALGIYFAKLEALF